MNHPESCKRYDFEVVESHEVPPCLPNTTKSKAWTIKNTGSQTINGRESNIVDGDKLPIDDSEIPNIEPSETKEIQIKFKTDSKKPGKYETNFRLVNPKMESFGPPLKLEFEVVSDNTTC